MPVLFGPVDFEPGEFADMPAHLQTEAALLAREWFGDRDNTVAKAFGVDVASYRSALKGRHAFSAIRPERIVDVDGSAEGRASALRTMLSPARAAAKVLVWLIRQPDGRTLLPDRELEEAVGLGYGAGRSAVKSLQRQDLIERTPGWRNRKPGWCVTRAGRRAAADAGLLDDGECTA